MQVPPVVVMGVSGSGKSTVAQALASRLGGIYLDADDYHPASNKAKMERGVPLTDADRAPWLDAVGRAMRERDADGRPVFMACSALRRVYRERLRAEVPGVYFLLLTASRAELERRLRLRRGHFMPASLLASQLATLEPLAGPENGTTITVSGGSADVLARAAAAVGRADRP